MGQMLPEFDKSSCRHMFHHFSKILKQLPTVPLVAAGRFRSWAKDLHFLHEVIQEEARPQLCLTRRSIILRSFQPSTFSNRDFIMHVDVYYNSITRVFAPSDVMQLRIPEMGVDWTEWLGSDLYEMPRRSCAEIWICRPRLRPILRRRRRIRGLRIPFLRLDLQGEFEVPPCNLPDQIATDTAIWRPLR